MTLHKLQTRVSIKSSFQGSLLAHAIAAQKMPDIHQRPADVGMRDEVVYQQILVRGYSAANGRLELPKMSQDLEMGLDVEKGRIALPQHFLEGELGFRQLADARKKVAPMNARSLDGKRIGGPGFAAHAAAIGLVNRNDVSRVIEDSFQIGRLTHRQLIAVSAGMVTALAIALAVTEGNDPGAVISRLMSTLRGPAANYLPEKLMKKMVRVEGLLNRDTDTAHGIKELRSKPRRTALDVVPGAIYAALNGARSLGGLLGPLKIFNNYKAGATAASIWGAMHGVEALPEHYLKEMEFSECVMENATRLYEATVG